VTELSAFVDVPLSKAAPAGARRAVESILRAWGFTDDSWLKTANVVVSELVTQAVEHATGSVGGIHLQTVHDQVVVTAVDRRASERSAAPAQPFRTEDHRDHALAIVQAMSLRWGAGDYPSGTRMWVQLIPHPPQREDRLPREDRRG
jgi:anti-sigma regulatory factor (Ser/Thr protein kinase)